MGTRSGEAGYGDDDRLPWLETVEEDYREGPSIWRILLLIVLALAVLGAIVFGVWWYQKQQGLVGNGELINAEEGDYKVPDSDGGAATNQVVASVASATGEGAMTNASVNMNAAPEAPVEGTKAPAPASTASGGSSTATVAVPANGGKLEARAPSTMVPAVAPGAGAGSLIQLGAFPDQQGADAAWMRLSKKFPVLAPLGKSVQRGDSNGKTVYRLRVNAGSNVQAKEICTKLQAASERCYVAN
jgi:hypothetical protein